MSLIKEIFSDERISGMGQIKLIFALLSIGLLIAGFSACSMPDTDTETTISQESATDSVGTQDLSEDTTSDASAPVVQSSDDVDTAAPTRPDGLQTATVERVVDGDTIVITWDGKSERLRLIGVDTPESVHPDSSRNVPYGAVSSAFTKQKLDGRTVGIELDVEPRDRYDRLLAYVWLDELLFNKLLLDEGHAMVSTYPPNVKYVDFFVAAQQNARAMKNGLWADADEPAQSENVPAESAASSAQSANEQTESPAQSFVASYIGSSNSTKFHLLSCQWGKKILEKNAVYFSTRDEALNAGYAPCKVCNP